jgi:hypothetical protein
MNTEAVVEENHDALSPPGITDERRRILEAEILFTLAGPLAERRVWRIEKLWPWWRFRVGQDKALVWHEASHACIAEITGVYYVHRICVVPTNAGDRIIAGFIITSPSAAALPPSSLSPSLTASTDSETVAKCCVELGGGWRGGVRELHRLRKQAIQMVAENWALIRAIAKVLSEQRTLDRAAFLAVLETHQNEQQIEIAASGVAVHNHA